MRNQSYSGLQDTLNSVSSALYAQNELEIATSAIVTVRTAPSPVPPKIKKLPLYKVILHNDDLNTMDYVADTVFKVTPLKPFESHQKMLEADESGTACLLVTNKEKAEFYRDQLVSKGLSVTVEPAE